MSVRRIALVGWVLAGGCPRGAPPEVAAVAVGVELPTPYTAEQIRDAMPLGTELRMLSWRDGQRVGSQRWVVLAADPEAVTIRFEEEQGGAGGEADSRRFTWEELRAHAAWGAGASRERARRDTALGALEGWTYRVTDADGVQELFFADAVPGPPVWMLTWEPDGSAVIMEQVSRSPLPGAQ